MSYIFWLLVLIASAVAVCSILVIVYVARTGAIGRSLTLFAARLGGGGGITRGNIYSLKSLLIGFFAATGLSAICYLIISMVASLFMPFVDPSIVKFSYAGAILMSFAIAACCWITVFSKKTLHTVTPTELAFATILGQPLGYFEAGLMWLPPYVSKLERESKAGIEQSFSNQENITRDGIPLYWDGSFLQRTSDGIKAQSVSEGARKNLAKNEFLAAVREFLTDQAPQVAALGTDLDPTTAKQLLADIAAFKIRALSGRDQIKESANLKLQQHGIELAEVQITRVNFSEKVEAATDRILEEIFQQAGLTRDAKNKVVMVEEMMKAFEGITLSPEVRADYVDRMADRALAIEGQATVTRVNTTGQGAIVYTNPPMGNKHGNDNHA